jgi:hypothetical protein
VSIFSAVGNLFSARSRDGRGAAEPLRLSVPFRGRRAAADSAHPRFRMLATDRSDDDGVGPQVREAFMPSQPVLSRNMLAGRTGPLQDLIQAVEDHRVHVVLYGERGIGKTSLLGVFAELAQDADYLVVRENCGADTTFDELFRSISSKIPLIYAGALDATEAQSRPSGTMADLLPQSALGPNQVSRLWSSIVGTRVLVILDEFDRTDNTEFHRDVVELLKNLSDTAARIQLVIAGVAQTLSTLLGHSPSIRRNVAGLALSAMTDREIAELIELGERHAAISFEPAAKEEIVDLARGRPYLTRLIAHHASLRAVTSRRMTVDLGDVEYAVERALVEMETRLSESTVNSVRAWLQQEPALVIKLATAGLHDGGTFNLRTVLAGTGKSNALEAFVNDIASSESLVVPVDDGGARYAFVEEGLPAYLMLASGRLGFAA